jgi:ABC-type nitrate/sulfonate/bicarbonate transport system ATPase subunit
MQDFLKIEALSKAYVAAKPVFADVSFTLDRGEFVCIIGHSGCGKTTILNVLAGLDTATSAMCSWTAAKSPAPAWSVAWCSRAMRSCPG